MERFKFVPKSKIDELPKTIGVYAFKSKAGLLYIGKAINIKERVKNHFNQPRYPWEQTLLRQGSGGQVGFWETHSEVEALLLEAQLIKKFQPKFNVVWRDDKNYFYVEISKTPLPKVSLIHQKTGNARLVGPFTEGRSLKKVLQLLRKIFPYYTVDKHGPKPCLWCQLGLCPGPTPDKKQYRKNLKNLIEVLEGKRQKVLRGLKKDMKRYSQDRDFEKAAQARDQIFSLERVISHAHIFENQTVPWTEPRYWEKTEAILKNLLKTKKRISRIEGYDVSNIQGTEATASMVVFVNGSADKSQYRKFKIKTVEGPNDTAMIKEALSRRMHNDWPLPDLIFIDGGKPQINAALSVIRNAPVCALAKRNNELYIEDKKNPLLLKDLPREIYNLILQIRDESHRFAITYHKKLRKRHLLGE